MQTVATMASWTSDGSISNRKWSWKATALLCGKENNKAVTNIECVCMWNVGNVRENGYTNDSWHHPHNMHREKSYCVLSNVDSNNIRSIPDFHFGNQVWIHSVLFICHLLCWATKYTLFQLRTFAKWGNFGVCVVFIHEAPSIDATTVDKCDMNTKWSNDVLSA